MSYNKLGFTSGQILKAEHLNNIENGIVANETAIAEKQPKGNYLTEHQKLKTINGESITGDGNISIGKPSDEQVESSVSAWLDEHPDAVAVTDKKMSDTSENAVANKTIKSYVDYSVPIQYTTSNGYIATSGKISTGGKHTNFIPVDGMTTIAISGKSNSGGGALFLAFYTDASWDAFMGMESALEVQSTVVTYTDHMIQIPEGAKYCAFSWFSTLEIRFPFKTFAKETQDFMSIKNEEVATLLQEVGTLKDTAVTMACGKNIFNKDTATIGGYLNTSNGTSVVAEANAFYSDFMEVEEETSYCINKGNPYWLWYDKDKNFIKSSSSLQKVTSPVGAKYLRIDVFGSLDLLDTMQIEVGERSTAYEEYRNVINYRDIDISLNLPFRIVSKDGRYGYKSIASAVKSINDDGIIYVLPGEYEESVQCTDKKIHIIGTSADECILWNSTGLYAECPLFQSAGSIRNMTIKAIRDPEKTYTEESSYAIHIDTYGTNKTFEIENCIIYSEFGSPLGCGAKPGHILTLRNNIITAKGNNNCFAYHLGAGESGATVRFIGNYIRHLDGNTEIEFQRGAGSEDSPERISVLAINNAVKRAHLPTPQYVLDEYSYGNKASGLNHTE